MFVPYGAPIARQKGAVSFDHLPLGLGANLVPVPPIWQTRNFVGGPDRSATTPYWQEVLKDVGCCEDTFCP